MLKIILKNIDTHQKTKKNSIIYLFKKQLFFEGIHKNSYHQYFETKGKLRAYRRWKRRWKNKKFSRLNKKKNNHAFL